MEFAAITFIGVLLIKLFLFLVSPNLSINKFLKKADEVDISSVRECSYGMSAFPCLNRLTDIMIYMLLPMGAMFDGDTDIALAYLILFSPLIVHSLIRMIVHYPCAYIKFSGNTVYYCNGKRTTSFKIDDIESILFRKYDKSSNYRQRYDGRRYEPPRFRYQYAILCFRTLVLECQRLNFVNEINQFFSSYKNQKRYNYQLEFDIFNFECSHEIFALLSQNVYVPIPVE